MYHNVFGMPANKKHAFYLQQLTGNPLRVDEMKHILPHVYLVKVNRHNKVAAFG